MSSAPWGRRTSMMAAIVTGEWASKGPWGVHGRAMTHWILQQPAPVCANFYALMLRIHVYVQHAQVPPQHLCCHARHDRGVRGVSRRQHCR